MKNDIKLIKKESFYQTYGLSKKGYFTPYYFINNNKEFFISNLVEVNRNKKHDSTNRTELADKIRNLKQNNFKFIRFYAHQFNNPIEFLEFVKKEKLTLQIHGNLFVKCDNFIDFHGNLKEISLAFMFRIYDDNLIKEIEDKLNNINIYYHYKND